MSKHYVYLQQGIFGSQANDFMRFVSTSFVNNYAHGDGGAGYFDQSHFYMSMQDSDSYAKTGHLESGHPYISQVPAAYGDPPVVLESMYLCGGTEVDVQLCDSWSDGMYIVSSHNGVEHDSLCLCSGAELYCIVLSLFSLHIPCVCVAGWSGNYMYFSATDSTLIALTLQSGLSCETQRVCLPPGTYTPFACGGAYPEEVSWEVLGLTGGATESCSGAPAGAASFTVGVAERAFVGYYLVFDRQTSVSDLDTVNVYSDQDGRGELLFTHSGSSGWPGVDLPPLHLPTLAVYVEFIGPDGNYVLTTGNW